MLSMSRTLVKTILLAAGLTACGSDVCITPPCPFPIAVSLTVSSAQPNATLSNVFVHVAGADSLSGSSCGQGPGTASCIIPGYAGTYQLAIGAAGFQTVNRTVVVTAPPPQKCGCNLPNIQHIDIALVPSP